MRIFSKLHCIQAVQPVPSDTTSKQECLLVHAAVSTTATSLSWMLLVCMYTHHTYPCGANVRAAREPRWAPYGVSPSVGTMYYMAVPATY